jgi:hypothetical protein
MAGQARDLPMRAEGESSVIITARACPVPLLAAYRADGHGRVTYQARMLLGQNRSSTPPVLRPAPRQPATPLRDSSACMV